jgi:hypothetical protein
MVKTAQGQIDKLLTEKMDDGNLSASGQLLKASLDSGHLVSVWVSSLESIQTNPDGSSNTKYGTTGGDSVSSQITYDPRVGIPANVNGKVVPTDGLNVMHMKLRTWCSMQSPLACV